MKAAKKFRQHTLTQDSEVKIFFMFPLVDVQSIPLLYAKTKKRSVSKEKNNLHKSADKNAALSLSCNCYLCYFLKQKRRSISTKLHTEITSQLRGIILSEFEFISMKSQILYFYITNFAASKFLKKLLFKPPYYSRQGRATM